MDETVLIRRSGGVPRLVMFCAGQTQVFPLRGRQTLGRTSQQYLPDILADSRTVSRNHGEFITSAEGTYYCDTGSTNGTLLNGTPLEAKVRYWLTDGDVLRIHGKSDTENVMDVLLVYTTQYRENTAWDVLPLSESTAEIVVGRGGEDTRWDKSVSRRHASFFHASGGWAIIDHGSKNGVFVNNRRLSKPVYLHPMDVIRIAEYLFIYTGSQLFCQKELGGSMGSLPVYPGARGQGKQSISIWIEERNVWQRTKKKTLLRDIRMEIPAGTMTLILGGSGAGKTTFMNAVMGYERAEGEIKYNGVDIYEEYEKMKYEIGYVPQQDLLRMSDTVYDTVLNAAEMRLPQEMGERAQARQAEKALKVMGLERLRDSQVSKLSGGQRKRLSIAVEYVGNPSLFFLDEPDSGLDGTMARSLMELLRKIADEGRIVILISHSPDRAFELFDNVIVLAKENADDVGRLVFFGSPKEACSFFDVQELEKIVGRINRKDEGGDGLADMYIQKYEKWREQHGQ